MPEPTIVLVHGAWADGSSWNAVSVELQRDGFTVLTPPNLLHGVAGDAAYRGPESGFLNLREGLVRALTEAGLRWGGTDFGNQSGDIMHFHLPESEVR